MKFDSSLFYTQPIFHMPTPEDAQFLQRLERNEGTEKDWALAYSFAQFMPEAYFTAEDRDAATGATRVSVCRYITASLQQIEDHCANGGDIACGYGVHHEKFGAMVDLFLPDVITQLVADFQDRQPAEDQENTASGQVEMVIARYTYIFSMKQPRPKAMIELNFDVGPIAGGEPNQDMLNETGEAVCRRIMARFEGLLSDDPRRAVMLPPAKDMM